MWLKFLSVLMISTISESANILCFAPITSISHQLLPRMLMRNLAERGHNVTLFTTDPFESNLPNLVQHSWHYTYELYKNSVNYARFGEVNIFETAWHVARITGAAIKLQLEHPAITELLTGNQTFDIVVVEAVGTSPFYAFARHFGVPLIGYTTFDAPSFSHHAVGNHIHPIVNPSPTILGSETLSFHQRLFVVFSELFLLILHIPFLMLQNDYIEQYFGPDMAKSVELVTNLDFLIFNNHPVFGSIRQTSPASLAVGFIHIEPTKPLIGDLENFFQESTKEIIYFSLGSNVKSADLSKKVLATFCDVFRKLPFNILWKWEASELENKPDNVKIVKWLPQQDVLAQNKTRLFITQGGQQSMEEAIYHAVPMLVIPFFADQFRNAHRIERLGVGLQIDLKSLTHANLEMAVNELLTDGTFQENAKQLSELAKDQPMTSLESAIWWIEYVIRHKGAKHLHPRSQKIPFYKTMMLDMLLAVGVVVYIGQLILRRILFFLKMRIFSGIIFVKRQISMHQKII